MKLEIIVQIISIFVFLGGGIAFFFKTGGYKSNIDTQLVELKEDTEENKQAIKEIQKDMEMMKLESNKMVANLNSSLAEIKTKLEMLVQYSGMFNNVNTGGNFTDKK